MGVITHVPSVVQHNVQLQTFDLLWASEALVLTNEDMEQVRAQKDEENDKHLKTAFKKWKKEERVFTTKTSYCVTEIKAKVYSALIHYVWLVLRSDDYMTLMHGLIL